MCITLFLTHALTLGMFFLCTDVLFFNFIIRSLFCLGIFCGHAHDCGATTKVCPLLYLRLLDLYGLVWRIKGARGAFTIYAHRRATALYLRLCGIHVSDLVLHIYQRRSHRLCLCVGCICMSTNGTTVVSDHLFTRWFDWIVSAIECHATNLISHPFRLR